MYLEFFAKLALILLVFLLPLETRWIFDQADLRGSPFEYGTGALYMTDILLFISVFLTGFLKLFRLRPGDRKNYDGLCPSFFVSTSALDMKLLALKSGDPHFAFLTNDIVPMSGKKEYFENFFADNYWIKEKLPARLEPLFHPRRYLKFYAMADGLKKIAETFFSIFPLAERILEKLQRRILPDELSRLAEIPDSGVFISSDVLKFHKNDRRAYFREKFEAKLKELCI